MVMPLMNGGKNRIPTLRGCSFYTGVESHSGNCSCEAIGVPEWCCLPRGGALRHCSQRGRSPRTPDECHRSTGTSEEPHGCTQVAQHRGVRPGTSSLGRACAGGLSRIGTSCTRDAWHALRGPNSAHGPWRGGIPCSTQHVRLVVTSPPRSGLRVNRHRKRGTFCIAST